ncbi:ankyrin repeat domain-containing protein [Winogradskyella arenosi]|uniref:Ankyrin repeat protein n=1 Tax=Winogradskyella arenosi TaxID=533325 RepID=A0A368ZD99_9FLAO|nr:ankyrin repeat domain-containing protein [Winogradskyella arenosi]RCW90196.1 ankyrin repeat protein [Winogradskyella arenosi]
MKKSVIVFALAFGFSMSNVNAVHAAIALESYPVVTNPVKVSPLCKAVAKGDLQEVNKLIEAGADVNAKSNGLMPIHYAAKYNRVEIIKALITAGSEIHRSCDAGFTPVRYAEKSNAKEAASFLKRFKK